jgi:phosphoserine phosphatase
MKMAEHNSDLWNRAQAAGAEAAEAAQPQMIGIAGRPEYGTFPICGFAWVKVTPGTCGFAKWLKAAGLASPSYSGGVDVWVSEYNQSFDRKLAYAEAVARVLRDAGLQAVAGSRLD